MVSAWEVNLTVERWIGSFHGFGYGGVLMYHRTTVNDIGKNFVFLEIVSPNQHNFEGEAEGKVIIQMTIVCPAAIKSVLLQGHLLSHADDKRRWGEVPMEERAVWAQEYGVSAKADLSLFKRSTDQRTLHEYYDPEWLEDHAEEFWDAASDYADGVLGLLGFFLDAPNNLSGNTGWDFIAGRL